MPVFPSSYTHSPTPSPQKPAQNFDQILPQKQMKSMSDIDKEEEARLAKSHGGKVKSVGAGICRWVIRIATGKGKEKGA